jgi:hypothetical protein
MARLRDRSGQNLASAAGKMSRGWASELLTWQQAPLWQEAETGRAKYFVAAGPYEVQAWAEVRDWHGRRRVNIGTFVGVAEAKAACEQHAAARLQQERDDPGPADVRIAPGRRR